MGPRHIAGQAKTLLYDLTRIGEWWLISVGLIIFAFVPYLYVSNGDIISASILIDFFLKPDLYLILLVVFSAQIVLFAVNDYYDRDVDALDPKKRQRNPVSSGRISIKAMWGIIIACSIISMVASAYFGLFALGLNAFALFVFYAYSAPPIRLKKRVYLDVISHATLINTYPYLFAMVFLRYFTSGSLFLLILVITRSAMAQILQEIRDYHIDKQVEENTVVVLGQRKAMGIVFVLYLTMIGAAVVSLVSYWVVGWGLAPFYLIFLFIIASYFPDMLKLRRTRSNYGKHIEHLWMGQGRTNRKNTTRYLGCFLTYFLLIHFIFGWNFA